MSKPRKKAAATKQCRICKTPKTCHFFSGSEWNRPHAGACRECLRTKKLTGGGKTQWRRSMGGLFL